MFLRAAIWRDRWARPGGRSALPTALAMEVDAEDEQDRSDGAGQHGCHEYEIVETVEQRRPRWYRVNAHPCADDRSGLVTNACSPDDAR